MFHIAAECVKYLPSRYKQTPDRIIIFVFLTCNNWKYTGRLFIPIFCCIVILFKVSLQQQKGTKNPFNSITTKVKTQYSNHKGSPNKKSKKKTTITNQTYTKYCATGYCFAFCIFERQFFSLFMLKRILNTIVVDESLTF